MTTKEVGCKLVQMCRDGKIEYAKEELFTDETVSMERAEGILPKENKRVKTYPKEC